MTEQLTRRNSDVIMHERITILETKQDMIHTTLKDHVDQEDVDKKEILKEIRCIKAEQNKQKGFMAGIAASVSAIVAAIAMAFKYFGN